MNDPISAALFLWWLPGLTFVFATDEKAYGHIPIETRMSLFWFLFSAIPRSALWPAYIPYYFFRKK